MFSARTKWFQQHADLLLFAAVGLVGLWGLLGWWTGNASWVQLRAHHHPFSPNTAFCFLALGWARIAAARGWARMARSAAVAAAIIATLGVVDALGEVPFGVHRLFTDPREVIAGARVGQMSFAVALLLTASAASLAWALGGLSYRQRPLLLALIGSAAAAYGFAAALGGRVGLERVQGWADYAQTSPIAALGFLLLGLALGCFASRTDGHAGAPRWLWLPVVFAGATISLLFYVSLRERENSYVNSTTQLTINSLATAFSAETEAQGTNLALLATHWDGAAAGRDAWVRNAMAVAKAFPAYRALTRIDASHRAQWVWPETGNEDAFALDHSRDPVRAAALRAIRSTRQFAVAAPILVPGKDPAFVIYAPVSRSDDLHGFIAGEISYPDTIRILVARLNLGERYDVSARAIVRNPDGDDRRVSIFGADAADRDADGKLRQTATFHFAGDQHLEFALTPRAGTLDTGRHRLPGLALFSGLGVSALLGLVVNLAQAAHRRRRRAEETSQRLRRENEERRRVEAQLKTSDERLNLALESTLVGVFEWDVATGETHYSASVWRALGYDPDAMPAAFQALLDLLHPEDIGEFKSAIDAHFRHATPFIEGEYRLRDSRGEWSWMTARAKCVAHDPAGRPSRVIGTCQDITARKQSEEALRESRAATRLLSHVARRTDNVVVIMSGSGTIEWVNESFVRVTGYQLSEVNGALFLDLLGSPDSDPRSLERVTAALVAAEPVTTEVIATSQADDRRYHLRLELQPVKSEGGALEHFIAIATDITSRVETEHELRRAKTEADAASRAKSEFLASMSHEIRTPMNGVIGMTSLLLQTNLDPEQKDYVETIRTSGDALLTIINEILDFSKIESGRMEIEQHPFEIAQCVEEALDMFALPAAAKNIELAYFIEPAVPSWILGDITRLRQVLVNLVNNAVKFTPQGLITVIVKLQTVEQSDGTRASYREQGSMMLDFFVTDTGIGIAEDRQHLLFKPFSQVDSSTTRKYGGTGLGLAICDRLCQLMGGDIDVTSKAGHGSTFRFSIFAAGTSAPPEIEFPQLPAWLKGTNVLVVDDLKLTRDLLGRAFAPHGLHLLGASMLHDAVELIMKNRISAAIIDVDLVGESGLPLAEQLHRDHPRLPIVLLTNPIDNARRTDSQNPYVLRLPKPVKPAFLIECMSRQFKARAETTASNPPVATTPTANLVGDQIPLKILLVEDNPVNQKVALGFLERLGYRADSASNGLEGVGAVERQNYDLVLMDVQMPEMDGLAATREIRTHVPAARQPRIIALTANAIQGDRERCLAAGMDDYIAKPVKVEALEAAIRKFFGPDATSR